MSEVTSIDAAIDINNKPTFNIDWELTYFCNLDCSYCFSHDNSTKHPDKEKCKHGIEFAFAYADLIVQQRKPYERSVSINILGGETLIHPDIVEILEHMMNIYNTKYKDKWSLTSTLTTNGIIGQHVLEKSLPLITNWIISYHTESLPKQKEMAVSTIYKIKDSGKRYNVRIMMHESPEKFDECERLAEQFDKDGIIYFKKVIGSTISSSSKKHWQDNNPAVHSYSKDQAISLLKYWNKKDLNLSTMEKLNDKFVVASSGYPCCSEKNLCVNFDRKNSITHVPQTMFKDWYCSVNWFFLFIRQVNEEIYHNKSCRARTDKTVGPIGTLSDSTKILAELKEQIDSKSVPVMVCPKTNCGCGLCAPKAKIKEDFQKIIKIHMDSSILKYDD